MGNGAQVVWVMGTGVWAMGTHEAVGYGVQWVSATWAMGQ